VSRSIHTIERDLSDATRVRCSHRHELGDERERLAEELSKKRRIKRQVLEERHTGARPIEVIAPDAIPILASVERPGVHHACSVDDVRAVLAALPGVTSGISRVSLTLGLEEQEEAGSEGRVERDPIVGRIGNEILPGYWAGRMLGAYVPGSAAIEIYAYVFAPDAPYREWVDLYLRLRALATLAHEIGHHHDLVARVARGRWLADDHDKREMYAEGREHAWVRDVIVPYLEQAYPRERAAFDAWMEHWAGMTVPLHELLDDPRATLPDGKRRLMLGMESALFVLFEDVVRGDPESATQVGFAREIHYAGRFAEARRVLQGVLARDPGHVEARVLAADIDVHEGEHDRAAAACREVLAREPSCADAWEVLTDAERGRGHFREARDAATAEIALREEGSARWFAALRERARARLELGEFDALASDLDALAQGKTPSRSLAAALRAMMLVRTGRHEEALAAARAGLADVRLPFHAELAAAGFEAAARLGRRDEAPPLPPAWRDDLRRRGFGAWVDALDAAFNP
jgi:tetratricopeptide (TPR) repeat protein